MDMKKRRDMQLAYIADEAVMEEQIKCRKILQRLNFSDRSDFVGIAEIVKELLGKSENACINPPFYCDYGSHIEVGKNFYANYNCTIIDVAKVKIGENCFMAPNVAIYTAGHPIYPDTRNSMFEYGKEVTIGDNVWLGGNPCHVIRKITEKDKRNLFHNEEIDDDAWNMIHTLPDAK